jgi:DNA (cytosine-5)-methyltransferase 1
MRDLGRQCLVTIFIASEDVTFTMHLLRLILLFRFAYDSNSATIKDIDIQRTRLVESEEPPDNCPVCLLAEQRDQEEDARKLPFGVAWHGVNYHIHDFAMIKAEQGPCHIGHIVHIRFRTKSGPVVTVKLLGRISTFNITPDITKDDCLMKDEVSRLSVVNVRPFPM